MSSHENMPRSVSGGSIDAGPKDTLWTKIKDILMFPIYILFNSVIYVPFLFAVLIQTMLNRGVAVNTEKWQEQLSQKSWIMSFTLFLLLFIFACVIPLLLNSTNSTSVILVYFIPFLCIHLATIYYVYRQREGKVNDAMKLKKTESSGVEKVTNTYCCGYIKSTKNQKLTTIILHPSPTFPLQIVFKQ